jgi:hypothetical protein
LIIPSEIEILRTFSFSYVESLVTVKFSPGGKIRSIGAEAFAGCGSLSSIYVPASVDFVGTRCFFTSSSLSVVEFEPGSKFREIEEGTFEDCGSLRSITIPSPVQILGQSYFSCCGELETVVFLPDSELVRLEGLAFDSCSSLSSLSIASLVEFIGIRCFAGCRSLSILMFGSPTRIRELLDVPRRWFGFHSIPDSVEHLRLQPDCPAGEYCVSTFNEESNFVSLGCLKLQTGTCHRSFLQISSRSLSAIPSNLKFDDSRF